MTQEAYTGHSGPYIVTTKRLESWTQHRTPVPSDPTIVSRRAVATLEEAQKSAHEIVMQVPGFATDAAPATAFARWHREIEAGPESGGTVGPLPDGTVIEVERVDVYALGEQAKVSRDEVDRLLPSLRKKAVVMAFNAAQAEGLMT